MRTILKQRGLDVVNESARKMKSPISRRGPNPKWGTAQFCFPRHGGEDPLKNVGWPRVPAPMFTPPRFPPLPHPQRSRAPPTPSPGGGEKWGFPPPPVRISIKSRPPGRPSVPISGTKLSGPHETGGGLGRAEKIGPKEFGHDVVVMEWIGGGVADEGERAVGPRFVTSLPQRDWV